MSKKSSQESIAEEVGKQLSGAMASLREEIQARNSHLEAKMGEQGALAQQAHIVSQENTGRLTNLETMMHQLLQSQQAMQAHFGMSQGNG